MYRIIDTVKLRNVETKKRRRREKFGLKGYMKSGYGMTIIVAIVRLVSCGESSKRIGDIVVVGVSVKVAFGVSLRMWLLGVPPKDMLVSVRVAVDIGGGDCICLQSGAECGTTRWCLVVASTSHCECFLFRSLVDPGASWLRLVWWIDLVVASTSLFHCT